MGFNDLGQVNLESVLAKQPDLMIAQLRAKPALTQSGVLATLKNLHIPVLFLDDERHPKENTLKSVKVLGNVLNREAEAKAYADFYQQRWQAIQQKIAKVQHPPTVFIEPIAGNSDNCCFTHGHNGWGALVEAVGGKKYRFCTVARQLRICVAGEDHRHEAGRLYHDRLQTSEQQRAAVWLRCQSNRRDCDF